MNGDDLRPTKDAGTAETPCTLREKAARIRCLAKAGFRRADRRVLLAIADELEAEAAEMERDGAHDLQ